MRLSASSLVRSKPVFALLTVFGLTALLAGASPPEQGVVRSTIPVVSAWPDVTGPGQLEISADGEFVIYQANRGDGWKLYRQRLDEPHGTAITDNDLAYFGHISPDGRWLLFGQKRWIWKRPLDGGEVTRLWLNNNFNMWETDDTIIIGRGANGLSRVPADGSLRREDFAPVDASTGATNYGRPSLLPGGKGALVSVGYGTGNENRHIGIVSLTTGKLTIIPERGAINPRYSGSGHILYTVGNTLKAIPFDLDRLAATGEAATIVDGVHVYTNAASQFDISKTGVLVYIPGPYDLGLTRPRVPVWVDRKGREQLFHTAEHNYLILRLSPNRRYLAAEGGDGSSLYVYDYSSGSWTQCAEGIGSAVPLWSADSTTLFYSRNNAFGRQAADCGSEWEELLPGDTDHGFWGNSLSPDGTRVLGTTFVRGSQEVWQLASVPTAGGGNAEPLLTSNGRTRRNPTLSRDGKWLAYVEKEGILDHVYVEPYPSGSNRLLVSGRTVDASEPVWGRGMELFYRDGANLISVQLEATPALRVMLTTPLVLAWDYARYLNTFAATYDYDPATDRFLMARRSIPRNPGRDIHVIENGFDVLNRLAPPSSNR